MATPIDVNEFLLSQARPTQAFRCELETDNAGEEWVHIKPCDANYDWLAFVEREGFDPNGPNGPTYRRVAETDELRYYSVFRRKDTGELVLLISEERMH